MYEVIKTNTVNDYKIVKVLNYNRDNNVSHDGWYYEHILIMEQDLGRSLNKNECVHHLDGNKGNNRLENLLLMTNSTHAKIHKWIDRCNIPQNSYSESPSCKICNKTLQNKQKHTCSSKCNNFYKHKKSVIPTKEILMDLISKHPFTKIGKMFNVSDNAVRKWCKKYNLI